MPTPERLQFACPHCGQMLRVPREHARGHAKCKNCEAVVRIPTFGEAAPRPEPLSLDDPAPPARWEPPRAAPSRRTQRPRPPAPAAGEVGPAARPVLLWVASAALASGLCAVVLGFAAGRWEVGPLGDRAAAAEQQFRDAKTANADLADRLASAEQRARDGATARDDLRLAKQAADAQLARAAKDRDAAAAAAGKLKTDLDAVSAKADALDKQVRSEAKTYDAAAGELRAAKAAQKTAEAESAARKTEIDRLRRDLDEAEKYGPFQAFAGRWRSREKLGDADVVTISIKGNGSCWASTATPAGRPGVANFQLKALKLVAKGGRFQFDDQLMNREWELTKGNDGDALTMSEVGGGRATFALVREKETPKK